MLCSPVSALSCEPCRKRHRLSRGTVVTHVSPAIDSNSSRSTEPRRLQPTYSQRKATNSYGQRQKRSGDSTGRHTQQQAPAQARHEPLPPYLQAMATAQQLLTTCSPSDVDVVGKRLSVDATHVSAALQLLHTASLPKGMAGKQQRDAAQQLTEALIHALKGMDLSTAHLSALSSICFSLGQLGVYDLQLLPDIEAASFRRMSKCSPSQLGQLAQGFTTLDHVPGETWRMAFMASCAANWHMMGPVQLASIGQAGAFWGDSQQLPVNFIAAWLKAVCKKVHECKPPQISKILTALRSLSPRCHEINAAAQLSVAAWHKINRHSLHKRQHELHQGQQQQQHLPGITARQLNSQVRRPSNVQTGIDLVPGTAKPWSAHDQSPCAVRGAASGSSSRSSSSSSNLFQHTLQGLVQQLDKQLADYRPAELAETLDCLIALKAVVGEPLLQQLLLQVSFLMPLLCGDEVATAVWAVAMLGAEPDEQWVDAALMRSHMLLPSVGCTSLARLVEALAKFKRRPYRAWFYEYCARCRVNVPDMNVQEVIVTLEAWACLRMKFDPEVLSKFVVLITSNLGAIESKDLQRLAAALKRMYRILPGRTVVQVVAEMERRSSFQT
eukprot:jgi/Chrzof1/2525/Cz11g18240.t1